MGLENYTWWKCYGLKKWLQPQSRQIFQWKKVLEVFEENRQESRRYMLKTSQNLCSRKIMERTVSTENSARWMAKWALSEWSVRVSKPPREKVAYSKICVCVLKERRVPWKSEEAPRKASGPLSGLQKKLQELEGRRGALTYRFDHLLLSIPFFGPISCGLCKPERLTGNGLALTLVALVAFEVRIPNVQSAVLDFECSTFELWAARTCWKIFEA